MARQDKDGFIDPAVVAAWRRMLWLMRGSAEVVEALVPVAAGMTKEEVSRLLARAGAPSGKGVEPVEQVLGLLGVVPRARYEALLKEYQTVLKDFEELGRRVEEAEQNIDRLRLTLREQGLADEAEQLFDSWGGLVRRTLRAQAGFVRSIASAAGSVTPALPDGGSAEEPAQPTTPEVQPPQPAAADAAPARAPRAKRATAKPAAAGAKATTTKRPAAGTKGASRKPAAAATKEPAPKRTSTRSRTAGTSSSPPASKPTKPAG